jgi:hypothetical protein
LEPQ